MESPDGSARGRLEVRLERSTGLAGCPRQIEGGSAFVGGSMRQRAMTQEQLRNLLTAFKARHGAEYGLLTLGYFGSYARECATPQSDVDVVFDTSRPNLFLTAMMKQDLELLLGRPVDVLQLRGLTNPRLRARIEAEAVYI
jgi:predicted nucleotidyltransferase